MHQKLPEIDLAFAYTIVYTLSMAKRKRTTRIIGMREFRENLSKFARETRRNNVHFVVMRHGTIAGCFTPPTGEELIVHTPPKSRKARDQALQEIRECNIQFPGHDGVAYQRNQRA